LIAAAASATVPVPDATLAPGTPPATASAPLLVAYADPLGSGGAWRGAPLTAPPVSPFVIVAPFRAPGSPWSAGHRGIDVAVAVGQPVVAPGGGYVSFAGWVVDRSVVVIAHDGTLRSSFEPVVATLTVGTRVRAGDAVGTVAASGWHCSPLPCLHWGVRRDTAYVDPLNVLAGFGPIRLLPIAARTPPSSRGSRAAS
jgi:murein DD-endopeptidase MepM/ murein hydrolase activator NlpD